MRKILDFMMNDLWLKIIAFLLALLLWSYITGQTNMTRDIDIPLQLKNIPEGMLLIGDIDNSIKVTAKGSPAVMMSLTKEAFIAEIDLANCFKNGTYLISPQVRPVGESVQLVSFSPMQVTVQLERVN